MDSEYISSLTDEQLAALREEIVESLDDDVRVNEAAIERLDRTNAIVDSPLYYTQDGGSMCNGIGRSYF